jgi:predicted  nucleic acid-binding Zn-ribbon protein
MLNFEFCISTMSPDLDRLIKLQQLDSTIAEARARVAAHPQRLADADARLAEAQQLVDAARQRLKDSQDARRALEKDAAVFQGRLAKFRDQQGAVKTNKEYQALGHEIEKAQQDLGSVEEKEIELMVAADAIAAEVKQAETAFAGRKKDIDAEKQVLGQELGTVEASLATALAARGDIVGAIDAALMAKFEQVAKMRKGVALCAATRDGLCSVCHVRLRPQVFQLVRQNDSIIQCDSCQRILYYVPPPPPTDMPVTHAS